MKVKEVESEQRPESPDVKSECLTWSKNTSDWLSHIKWSLCLKVFLPPETRQSFLRERWHQWLNFSFSSCGRDVLSDQSTHQKLTLSFFKMCRLQEASSPPSPRFLIFVTVFGQPRHNKRRARTVGGMSPSTVHQRPRGRVHKRINAPPAWCFSICIIVFCFWNPWIH